MGNAISTKHLVRRWRSSPAPSSAPAAAPTLLSSHAPTPRAPPGTPMATAPALLSFAPLSSHRSPTFYDWRRYFSPAPPLPGPSPPAAIAGSWPPPPAKTVVKVATSVATVVPVVLSVLPFFHQVYTGSFDRTIELYGAPAMAGGLLNSIIWLMYAIVTSKKELSIGLLLTHAFLCMATFAYLMSICAHKRATKQGYALGAFFIVCLSIISTVPHWDINPSEFVKDCFGYLGLFLLATCHLIQICGILDGLTKRSQKIATVVDVLPSCLMNMVTSIITAQAHPKQQLILASSIIGFAFTFIEIILVIIGPILGYVFPLAHNRIVDPEALTQHDHPSDTLNLNSSTQEVGMTAQFEELQPPLDLLLGTLQVDDSIVLMVLMTYKPQHEPLSWIIQLRNGYEIFNQQTGVLIVEAIPREILRIGRDLYIPMLLQASGIANAEPNPMLLRDLGIKYLLRDLEIQYWVARGRLEALQQY